jgi:outer membrane protein assembly factor BamD (BamD/ComL family)
MEEIVANKKLSRKQMKKMMHEDEFASTMDKVLEWAKKHKAAVIGGFVALFAIAGIYVTAVSYNKSMNENSELALSKAIKIIKYQPKQGEVSKYPSKKEQLQAAIKEFKAIYEGKYTKSVKQRAGYYLATSYLEQEDTEKCAKILGDLYTSSSYPFKSLVAVKYSGILQDRGDLKKAMEVLDGLSEKNLDKNLTVDYVMLLKAKLLVKMSKLEEAKQLLNQLISDYKNSVYVTDAKQELEKIKG